MTTEQIKKELYKQNPIAEYGFKDKYNKIYSCEIIHDDEEKEITFSIPFSEATFEDKIPAKLLIRWLNIN